MIQDILAGPRIKPPAGTLIDQAGPLANGMAGAWVFNENTGLYTQDVTGNNRNLTLIGTTWDMGPNGPVLSFNGTSSYATAGNLPIFELGPGFSLYIRFRLLSNTGDRVLAGKMPSGSASGWVLQTTSSTNIQLFVKWSTTSVNYNATVPAMGANWHDVLLQVADDGYHYITLDGVSYGSAGPGVGAYVAGSAKFSIGARDTGTIGYMSGVVDVCYVKISPPIRDTQVPYLRDDPYRILEADWPLSLVGTSRQQTGVGDLTRQIGTEQSGVGDTTRQRATEQTGVGDTTRQVIATQSGVGDTTRRIGTEQAGVGDTLRQRGTEQAGVADTYRQRAASQTGVGDLYRTRATEQSGVGDTDRQVIVSASSGVGDLLRRLSTEQGGVADTRRQITTGPSSGVGDLLRRVAEEQTGVGDLVKSTALSFLIYGDTRRDVGGSDRRHVQPNASGVERIQHGDLVWVRHLRAGQEQSRRMREFFVQNEMQAVPVRFTPVLGVVGPETPEDWQRELILPDGTTEIITVGNRQSGVGDLLRPVVNTESGVGDTLMEVIASGQSGVGDLLRQRAQEQTGVADTYRQRAQAETGVADLKRQHSSDQSGVGDTNRQIGVSGQQGSVGDLKRQVAQEQTGVGDTNRQRGTDQAGVGDTTRQPGTEQAGVGDTYRKRALAETGVGDLLRHRAQEQTGKGDTLRQVSSNTGFRTLSLTDHDGLVWTITQPWKGPYSFIPAAGARTLFVATTGVDAPYPGRGTAQAPFRTPSYAVAQANAGDLIYIYAGTYSGNDTLTNVTGPALYVNKSGTAAAPIIISAYPGDEHSVILNMSNPTTDATPIHVVRLHSANHIWLHGLTIQGTRWTATNTGDPTTDQSGIAMTNGGGVNCRFYNCIVKDCWHTGFKTAQADAHNFLIESCVGFDIGTGATRDHFIYISTHEATVDANCVVRGNVCFRIRAYGYHYNEGSPGPKNVTDYDNQAFVCGYGSGGNASSWILGSDTSKVAYGVGVNNPRGGMRWYRQYCTGNTMHGLILVNNLQHQVGWDDAGGPSNPTGNNLQHSVIYPAAGPTWNETAELLPQVNQPTIQFTNPTFNQLDIANRIYDLRLPAGSPLIGSIPQLTGLNGLGANAPTTPGIFSGALWTEPTL